MPYRYILYVLFLLIPLVVTAITGMVVSWTWIFLLFMSPIEISFIFVHLRRQRMVAALVRTAMESDVPIHDALESYAVDCLGPWYREKVMNFAFELRQGHSIVLAARKFPGVLRYDIAALLGLGGVIESEEYDALLAGAGTKHTEASKAQSMFQVSWIYGYLPIVFCLTVFFMYAIVPKFKYIVEDFDTQLPPPTLIVIRMSESFFQNLPLVAFLVLLVLLLPLIYFMVRSGSFPWRPPGLRRILRRLDAARFLRILALGWKRGHTFAEIVDVYVFVVGSYYQKDRARNFLNRIEDGVDWIDALRAQHWINRPEAALLDAAARSDNVPDMLQEIAAGKEQQQLNADHFSLKMFFFVFLLLIGAFVGLIALACFMPLTTLILNLVRLI